MIPASAFDDIIEELERRPLEINNYRVKTGSGRSQAFGIVGRRSSPPDYSRQCWIRPELYSHLLDFGEMYVKDISWNAITLNQNFLCKPHYDKHNRGPSLLCAFGDYEGGELVIHEGDLSGSYDVRHNPLTTDFSKVLHSVTPFTGNRYSVVYYYFEIAPYIGKEYEKAEVRFIGGDYAFYRGGVKCTGLPHPLKGFKRKPKIDKSAASIAAKDGTS